MSGATFEKHKYSMEFEASIFWLDWNLWPQQK